MTYRGGGPSPSFRNIATIEDTYARTVSFTYDAVNTDREYLTAISVVGAGLSRNISYTYELVASGSRGAGLFVLPSPGRRFLKSAVLGTNVVFQYSYAHALPLAENQFALRDIVYPNGGMTRYEYGTKSFFTGREMTPFAVVVAKTTSGRGLPTARWTYDYLAPNNVDVQSTTVTRPDGFKDVYKYTGFGYPKRINAIGAMWKVGLLEEVSRGGGAEVEKFTWSKGAVVATANYAGPGYGGAACPGWFWDDQVFRPFVSTKDLIRLNYESQTVYESPNKYGQPSRIVEYGERQRSSGQPVRTTTLKYFVHELSNQVDGRAFEERVCQGPVGSTDCTLTLRTFDALPDLWRVGRLLSETVNGVETKFSYNNDRTLQSVTNAAGNKLTLSNYAFGVARNIDFNGAFSISRTVNGDGSLASETDSRGNVVSYEYDDIGRIKKVTPPSPNAGTTYAYAADGASITVATGSFSTVQELDGLGRVIGTTNSLQEKTTTEYDPMGRVVFQSQPFKTPALPEVGVRTDYDALGRAVKLYQRYLPSGHRPLAGACATPGACETTTTFIANHCSTTSVNRGASNSIATTRCFESFGDLREERLISVLDAKGSLWKYTYDIEGNLKNFTAPLAGGNRTLTYDPSTLALKTETTAATGTRITNTYDSLARPTKVTDSRGIVAKKVVRGRGGGGVSTSYSYADPLSRVRKVTYGTSLNNDVNYTYSGHLLSTVSSVNGGTITFGYDSLNRVASKHWVFQGNSYTTIYNRDSSGCLTQVKYPTGTIAVMTCDQAGRPVTLERVVTGSNKVLVSGAVYHPAGRASSIALGNARTISNEFEHGRLKSTRVLDLPTSQRVYQYDGADNVLSVTGVDPSSTASPLVYDELNRLSRVGLPPAGEMRLEYDALGNRTSKSYAGSTTTYTYNQQTNRLETIRGQSTLAAQGYFWDEANRLSGSTIDGSTYLYDGLGMRVARTNASSSIVYHYDVAGHLLAETTSNGAKVREYFYLGDKLIAVEGCLDGSVPGCSELQWYHQDVAGNVISRLNANGQSVREIRYLSWGEAGSAYDGVRLFNGRVFDPGTGLYDFGARVYSPELGRFLSADSAWASRFAPEYSNQYAFALNNPYKYSDPDGHVPLMVFTAAAGALIGGGIAIWQTYDSPGGVEWGRVATYAAAGAVAGATLGGGASMLASYGAGSVTPLLSYSQVSAELKFAAAILAPTLFKVAENKRVQQGFVEVFHKGRLQNGMVLANRTLSTGVSREAVSALQRPGVVNAFRIPVDRLREWLSTKGADGQFLATKYKDFDMATGVQNDEIRFSAEVASELQRYLVK